MGQTLFIWLLWEGQDRKQTINVAEANECTNASMAAQNIWQQGVLAILCASVCTAAQRIPSMDIELGGGLAGIGGVGLRRWHTDPHTSAF